MRSVGKRIQGGVVRRIGAFHGLQTNFLSVSASLYRVFCLPEEPPRFRFKTQGVGDMQGHPLNAKLVDA